MVNEREPLTSSHCISDHLHPFILHAVVRHIQLCQRAADACSERLADQLGAGWANLLVGCIDGRDLAVLVAADARQDGTPALVPQLIGLQLDGRQRGRKVFIESHRR